MCFELSPNSREFQEVKQKFNDAMQILAKEIIRIERIQNERWYVQYLAHQKDFKSRLNNDTERCLFHGCPEQAANSIITDCFNRSHAGANGKFRFRFQFYFRLSILFFLHSQQLYMELAFIFHLMRLIVIHMLIQIRMENDECLSHVFL